MTAFRHIAALLTVGLVLALPAAAAAGCAEEEPCPRETGGPPSYLNVTVTSRHGSSYRHPGHTDLTVATDAYAEVWVRTRWQGDSTPSVLHFKERLESEEGEWEEGESDGAEYEWSCTTPMQVVSYEVEVKGESDGVLERGAGLTHAGTFVESVSRKWCEHIKAREAHASWERSQRSLSCGNISARGGPFSVNVAGGGATCEEARRALATFMNGGGEEHGGVESPEYLKSWSIAGGWKCGYGTGGGGCRRRSTHILAQHDG